MESHIWITVIVLCLSEVMINGCPTKCKCDHSRKSVLCTGHSIRKIPRDLPLHTKSLSLFGTAVTVIDDELWRYKSLQGLYLGDNRLAKIRPHAFRGLYHLRYLDLSRNHLTDTVLQDDLFQDQEKVLWLNINKNFITKITYPVFKNMKSLYKLNLGSNKIEKISPSAFFGLTKLRFLRLWDNKLTSIPGDALRYLSSLESISLHTNMIKEINSHGFRHVTKLKAIDLDSNWIERITDDAFISQKSLHTLHLHKNNLKEIPVGALMYLNHLEHIDLDHNLIVSISPHAFSGMKHLKSIKLSYMDLLESVESMAFSNLPSLKSVYMHSNPNLVEIAHDAFENTPSMTTIQLHHNALEYISESLLPWEQLRTVWLHGNAWRCNCNLKWLAEVVQQMSWTYYPTKCVEPRWLKNKFLSDLSPEEFVCY